MHITGEGEIEFNQSLPILNQVFDKTKVVGACRHELITAVLYNDNTVTVCEAKSASPYQLSVYEQEMSQSNIEWLYTEDGDELLYLTFRKRVKLQCQNSARRIHLYRDKLVIVTTRLEVFVCRMDGSVIHSHTHPPHRVLVGTKTFEFGVALLYSDRVVKGDLEEVHIAMNRETVTTTYNANRTDTRSIIPIHEIWFPPLCHPAIPTMAGNALS